MRIIKYFARAPWSSSDKLARHEPRLRLRLRQSRTRRRGRTRGSGKMASFRLWSQPLRPPDSWKQIVSLVTKNYSLWPPKKYKLSSQKVSQPIVFFSNLCWKFVFCPLTIFSTDKDPPEGGEKGNRWQSETINSLCRGLYPGSCHSHRAMSPTRRGWGVWELGQMSGECLVWSVAF